MNYFDKTSEQLKEPPLRSPEVVMKLERLGAFFPNRLSFARSLVRRMSAENWLITKEKFDLNKRGVGTAVYKITTPIFPLWFVVFADHLDVSERTDRVIAEKWDATFTLTTREPDVSKLQYLRKNIPLQEAGRCTSDEIILSRANKSVRLFDYVVEKLALGQQPDPQKLIEVGYLMRTTAVYGNGKFGLSDFENLQREGLFKLPFQAEMLCVYLARNFSFDWVEEIARKINPELSCRLDDDLKQTLGVGNATGLGMAPFLIRHPKLISSWILTREKALQKVKSVKKTTIKKRTTFKRILKQAQIHIDEWSTEDEQQLEAIKKLKHEVKKLLGLKQFLKINDGWENFLNWTTNNLSLETQELLNSIILECYPELVDHLESETGSDELMLLDPAMHLLELKEIINKNYGWAMAFNLQDPNSNARFWYSSVEKEEPRIGWRGHEAGSDKEMRLGIVHDVQALYKILELMDLEKLNTNVAEFLLFKPEFREIIQRVQSLRDHQYAEIRDNLLHEFCRPIDLLRCKLAMFGATRFDPKSNLWIRITLFQGAPLKDRLYKTDLDNWLFPYFKNSH